MASTLSLILAILTLAFLPTAIPTAPTGCGARLLLLAPCMPFMQGVVPAPNDACCGGLVNVYRSRPHCLCNLLDGSTLLPINLTLAQHLPLICRLALPVDDHSCPGLSLSLPPVQPPTSEDITDSPAAPSAASPPAPREDNLLLRLNDGGKRGVEGSFIANAMAVILLLLAGLV